MRGFGYFLLFLALIAFVLSFGLGFIVYMPLAGLGVLFVIAGNQSRRPVAYRPRRRYRRR